MIKKLLSNLTNTDLINRPIWEHWAENNIEFVTPSNLQEISESCKEGHIVLTEFKLNNGKKLYGFCSPQEPSGLDYIQPTIISEKGLINLWKENDWTIEEENEILEIFKIDRKSIFPIEYRTMIKCDGEFHYGKLNDFNCGE